MKRALIAILIGVLGFAANSTDVWAQATAQVGGTVRDQSGAVLPGVEVTATQTQTGISRMTVSNETGTYVLPNLPLGRYRLEAALAGFRPFSPNRIVLEGQDHPGIKVLISVGPVKEQGENYANAPVVKEPRR